MIHRSTITFGAKYLTGMVTSVAPYETFSLIKNNILHRSNNYKNHFENSNFWVIWPLGHVGHVTYSFINMLFISTRIFYDKLRPQILSVGTTANAALSRISDNSKFWNGSVNFEITRFICTLYIHFYIGSDIKKTGHQNWMKNKNCTYLLKTH